jgi:hypothetical protein
VFAATTTDATAAAMFDFLFQILLHFVVQLKRPAMYLTQKCILRSLMNLDAM